MSTEYDMAIWLRPVTPGNCPGKLIGKVTDAVREYGRAVCARSQVQLGGGLPGRLAGQEVLYAFEGAGGLARLGISDGN
jgi:hypothetical protein